MAAIVPQLIVLTLDEEEAKFLLALTGRVVGSGEWREVNARIYDALAEAIYASRSEEWVSLPPGVKLG
jgi:hypothetical protein